MKTYLIFSKYTSSGLKNIKEAPKRIKDGKEKMKNWGVEVVAIYALFGDHDALWIVRAPDDKVIAKCSLYVGSLGNVKIETVPALTEDEFLSVVKDLP